jgi:hypothetical protein
MSEANTDFSGDWGYGNLDGTGAAANFVTANYAQATPFGGPYLDGPDSIDGLRKAGWSPIRRSFSLARLGAIQGRRSSPP